MQDDTKEKKTSDRGGALYLIMPTMPWQRHVTCSTHADTMLMSVT